MGLPLSGPGVRIVLAGVGRHPAGGELADVPAVADSVRDLAAEFTGRCGVPADQVAVVVDPDSPLALGAALTDAAAAATDVLVCYYVGHGLIGDGGELHLATGATDDLSVGLAYKALPYSAVRDALATCRAPATVVILDCCFSGRAPNAFAVATLRASELAAVHGSYLLSSAAREEQALAPDGARYTAFTGALIELLRTGDPAGPPELTLDHVYRHLARILPERDAPRPHRQATDLGGQLVLAANPAAAGRTDGTPAPSVATDEGGCPYRGMNRFDKQDAPVYFGRGPMTDALVSKVARRLAEPGMIAVVGPSGSGKSSLLRAGLLAALENDDSIGGRDWPQLVLTPGDHPMATLARKLPGAQDTDLVDAIRVAYPDAGTAGRRVLLVVDQLEQVFTADEQERGAFLRALDAASRPAADDTEPVAIVVLAVRADFYQHCLRHPELARALADGQVPIVPMTEAELRDAIELPATAAGLTLEPGLADLLLADLDVGADRRDGLADAASALPLLSFALVEIWQKRSGATLTFAGYQATTGIWQAVRRRADQAYETLDQPGRDAARRVLLSMIRIGTDTTVTADTHHPVDMAALSEGDDADATDRAVHALAAAGLVTVDTTTVRITHEALLRAWPRLRGWLTENRQELLARQQLHDAATAWLTENRDRGALYRGRRLDSVRHWAKRPELAAPDAEFLRASIRLSARARAVRRSIVVVLAVLTLVASGTAVWAFHNAATANQAHATALSRQLAAEALNLDASSPVMARQLAVAAWSAAPTTEAASAMATLLAEQQTQGMLPAARSKADNVGGIAFSPNGRVLAVGGDTRGNEGALQLWDPLTGRRLGAPSAGKSPSAQVTGVAVSPDGRTVVGGDESGAVWFWDASTGRVTRTAEIADANGYIQSLSFSPDGRVLAVGVADRSTGATVRLWNAATAAPIGRPLAADVERPDTSKRTGTVNGLAFSPDGRILASADGDGTVRLWNPATGAPIGSPLVAGSDGGIGPDKAVNMVAFSPDGQTLASADDDGTVRLWNPATGAQLRSPIQLDGDAIGVTFSPDGTLMVTDDDSGNAELWDAATGSPIGKLPNPVPGTIIPAIQNTVAFSPDGHLLAYQAGDNTVRLWNVPARHLMGSVLQANAELLNEGDQVAFSPDGRLLATADMDGTVRLWNPVTDELVRTIQLPQVGPYVVRVLGVSFSPDGRTLASADNNGAIRLWNPATGQPAGPPIMVDGVSDIAFRPHNPELALTVGQYVQLWDAVAGVPISEAVQAPGGADNTITDIAFSPDGGKLLALDNFAPASLFYASATEVTNAPLRGTMTDRVEGAAFSPDNRTLAVLGLDQTVRLFDTITGRSTGQTFTIDSRTVGAQALPGGLAYSPDGRLLVVGYGTTVQLLDAHSGHLVGGPLPAADAVHTIAVSPDGQTLAVIEDNGDLWLPRIAQFTDPYTSLCADVGLPSSFDWATYVPNEQLPAPTDNCLQWSDN